LSPPGMRSTARPRIVFIAPTPAPYRAFFYDELARRLPQYRFLAIFQEGAWSDMQWKDDRPHRMRSLALRPLDLGRLSDVPVIQRVNPGMRRILERAAPDAIVTHALGTPTGKAISHWARRRRVPFFLRCDTNFTSEMEKSTLRRALRGLTFRFEMRRAFGALSLGVMNEAVYTYYGLGPERQYRVPFLIDADAMARRADEERATGEMRGRLGIRSSRVLLFVGRLRPIKGVSELLEAFLELHAEFPDVDLLIVGDGPLKETLQARAGRLLGTRVHMPGFLQPDAVARCFGAADVCVAASRNEPWGLVLNEAMAAGTAVITTHYFAAAADLLAEPGAGRLVPRDDPCALADCLRSLLSQPGLLPEMGRKARSQHSRWISLHDPVDGVARALQAALRRKAR